MISALLVTWLALLAAGQAPIGRAMRRLLVEWPATRLNRLSRGAVLTWLILGTIGLLAFWLLEEDGLRLFTMALPELAGWVTMFEVSTLVDTLAAVALAASAVRFEAVRGWIARARPTRRAKRARRVPGRRAPSNDDGEGPAALAA